MRFCQQCARLQSVDKFKGDRRSCQVSLELHNKRQAEGASAAVAAGVIAPPQCQVPGCTEDLLQHKVYNQRYKICPFHRTQPAVDIGGKLVRFCQQCAKTHSVEDFEGSKRSCKEKLERINNRRLQLKRTLEERESNPEMPFPIRAFCQVPGCEPDPKDMKVYNIRNKVCNAHLGEAEVDMNGEMMRFCRQCARFQPTSEFDGLKRSCRLRLEKHNERRRVAAQQAKSAPKGDVAAAPAPALAAPAMESVTVAPAAAAVPEVTSAPLLEESPAPAAKMAKVRRQSKGNASGTAACQVPGCARDLKDEKTYNVRYKVCGEHLTMPQVDINGQEMRFCQQCARFQPISDFDALKRSCRERLQKHNQRGRAAYQRARASKGKGEEGAPDIKLEQAPPQLAA